MAWVRSIFCPNLERTSVLGFFLILGSDIGRPAGHVLLNRNRRERRQVVERRREVEKRELNESSPTQLKNSSACLRMIYHQVLMELSRLYSTEHWEHFIWLVRTESEHSIPAVWGWLPNKKPESYEAFFLMVKLELAKMGYQLKVKSVNCDFELSICKAIDSVLNIVVNGCFFQYTQALKRFTEKHGTKRVKDSDLKFNNFVRESVG